ncbi:hypothetical protein RQP46_003421 [Phenoliferia psychrophenolica]
MNRLIPRLVASAARPTRTLSSARPFLALPSATPSAVFRAPYATSTTPTSSSFDPQTVHAQNALDEGSLALELGDLAEAEKCYKKSLEIKETPIAHYNLGVVQYQLQDLSSAIASFHRSLVLSPATTPPSPSPSSPPSPPSTDELTPAQLVLADTHTNLGAAYILSSPPRPDLALEHLQKALEINPDDAELVYNLAAVLEATEDEEEALVAYQRAESLGIERAAVNIRNIGAKILGKRLKEEAEEEAAKKAAAAAPPAVAPKDESA